VISRRAFLTTSIGTGVVTAVEIADAAPVSDVLERVIPYCGTCGEQLMWLERTWPMSFRPLRASCRCGVERSLPAWRVLR
jgi:hypothetical protein